MSALSAPRLSVYSHPPLCLHVPSSDFSQTSAAPLPSQPPKRAETPLSAPLRQAILQTRNELLERLESAPTGDHWTGLLPADASLSARFVMLLTYLGHQESPRVEQLAEHLRQTQLATGGWARSEGEAAEGEAIDFSATVQCYLALKLATGNAADADLRHARQALANGLGSEEQVAQKIDEPTRQWLYQMGQTKHRPTTTDESLNVRTALRTCKPLALSPRYGIAELGLSEQEGSSAAAEQAELPLQFLASLTNNHANDADHLLWRRLALEGLTQQDQSGDPQAIQQAIRETEDLLETLIVEDEERDAISLACREDHLATTAVTIAALRESGASLEEVAAPVRWLMEQLADQLAETMPHLSARELALSLSALQSLLVDAASDTQLPPSMRLAETDSDSKATPTASIAIDRVEQLAAELTAQLIELQQPLGEWSDTVHGDVTSETLAALACRVGTGVRTAVKLGVNHLRAEQDLRGCWPQIRSDAKVVQALQMVGLAENDPVLELAQNWIAAEQPVDENDLAGTAEAYLAINASSEDAYKEITDQAVSLLLERQSDPLAVGAEARLLVALSQAAEAEPRVAAKPVTLKLVCG